MEESKEQEKDKKHEKMLILLIIILLLLIVGISFAYYRQKINTGDTSVVIPKVVVTYKENTNNSVSKRMKDEEAIKSDNHFDFDVSFETSGNISLGYIISIEEDSNNNIDKNNMMVYLTDTNDIAINDFKGTKGINMAKLNDNVIDRGSITLNNGKVYKYGTNEEIKNIINYRLRYWVDNNFEITPSVTDNDGLHIMESKVYTFKFKVNVLIYEI